MADHNPTIPLGHYFLVPSSVIVLEVIIHEVLQFVPCVEPDGNAMITMIRQFYKLQIP